MNGKAILASLLTIGLAATMLGAGVAAYFNDTETSTGNTMSAGTLDLKINELNDPTDIIVLADMAPGVESSVYEIRMTNDGSIDGVLEMDMSYTEADDTDAEAAIADDSDLNGEVDALEFASHVYVTSAMYTPAGGDERDVLPEWIDYADTVDVDGMLSIHEMSVKTWTMTETLTAEGTATIKLKFTLDSEVSNDYQADGISVTLEFTLDQLVP